MGKVLAFDVERGGTFSNHWAVKDNLLEDKTFTYIIHKN